MLHSDHARCCPLITLREVYRQPPANSRVYYAMTKCSTRFLIRPIAASSHRTHYQDISPFVKSVAHTNQVDMWGLRRLRGELYPASMMALVKCISSEIKNAIYGKPFFPLAHVSQPRSDSKRGCWCSCFEAPRVRLIRSTLNLIQGRSTKAIRNHGGAELIHKAVCLLPTKNGLGLPASIGNDGGRMFRKSNAEGARIISQSCTLCSEVSPLLLPIHLHTRSTLNAVK